MTTIMSPSRIIAILCLLSLFLCASVSISSADNARFLSAIDGDSLVVSYKGRSQEVRLIGIDAPEWGQEYGTRAKTKVMGICYGKTIRLEFDRERRDHYGRLLAYVYCGGRMLNLEMIREGMAIAIKVEPNIKYYERFKDAENNARKKRAGFWLHGGLKMTPYQWRKEHRK